MHVHLITSTSKIQLVVYYQCCVLIGRATTTLYVIAHQQHKAPAFWRQKRLKVQLSLAKVVLCSTFSEQREQTTHRLVAYKPGIKTMQNYKPSSQEAVKVACERYSFTRDSVIRLRVGKCWGFGSVLAYCAWSVSRGGHM